MNDFEAQTWVSFVEAVRIQSLHQQAPHFRNSNQLYTP